MDDERVWLRIVPIVLLLLCVAAGVMLLYGDGTEDVWTIDAEVEGEGTVDPMVSDVVDGGSVSLNLRPAEGWELSTVYLDGDVVDIAGDVLTIVDIHGDHHVRVVFSEVVVMFTVSASASTGGSISPSGDIVVAEGGSVEFSIAAEDGYRLSSLMVDGVSVGGGMTSYVLGDVRKDTTVHAVFVPVSPGPSPTPAPTPTPSPTPAPTPTPSPVMASITVSDPPTSAFVGDAMDLSGKVYVTWSDGSRTSVSGYTVSPEVFSSPGPQTVTVSYMGMDCRFTVDVSYYMMIAVTTLPAETVYDIGDPVDMTGSVVTVTYHDGRTAAVTFYDVSADTGSEGPKDVLVIYTEGGYSATASFPIYVASAEGFSAFVISEGGPVGLRDYVFGDPMAPGESRVLRIEVRNNTSVDTSTYLVLEYLSGSADIASAVAVSCNGCSIPVSEMGDGTSVPLDIVYSNTASTVAVTISMDPEVGNELMGKALSFKLEIFADGIPPTGGP